MKQKMLRKDNKKIFKYDFLQWTYNIKNGLLFSTCMSRRTKNKIEKMHIFLLKAHKIYS